MCKYHVEYSIRTKRHTKSFSIDLSSPNGDSIEEFIISRLHVNKIPGLVNITSVKPLPEQEWKELYIKSLS